MILKAMQDSSNKEKYYIHINIEVSTNVYDISGKEKKLIEYAGKKVVDKFYQTYKGQNELHSKKNISIEKQEASGVLSSLRIKNLLSNISLL